MWSMLTISHRLRVHINFLVEILHQWLESVAKSAQPESENRPWHYFHAMTPIAGKHPIFMILFHLSAYATANTFPKELHLCTKTSPTLNFPLSLPPASPQLTLWDSPLVLCQWSWGRWFYAHVGVFFVRSGATPPVSGRTQSRSTADS